MPSVAMKPRGATEVRVLAWAITPVRLPRRSYSGMRSKYRQQGAGWSSGLSSARASMRLPVWMTSLSCSSMLALKGTAGVLLAEPRGDQFGIATIDIDEVETVVFHTPGLFALLPGNDQFDGNVHRHVVSHVQQLSISNSVIGYSTHLHVGGSLNGRKMARRVRAGMFVGSCGSFSGKCYLLFGGVRLLRLRSVTGATTPGRNSISGYIRDLMPRLYF